MSERVPPSLSGQLAGHCGVEDPSAASGSGSSVCRNLGIVVNWEKSDLQLSTRVQYLGTLIDTSLEAFPPGACLARFREVVTSFLILPSSPAHMWRQLLGHMASLERFLPRSHLRMCPLQWCLKDHWSAMVDDPAVQIPLSQEWLQDDRWVFGVPLQVPPLPLLLHTNTSLLSWGAHLLDLMALRVWSQKESSLHINVLEMKAVVLALASFLPQLSGQSVILMSYNATGVAYLPESRRHSVSCPMSHGSQGSALNQAPFSFPDGQVYPRKEKCSGAPAQWSRPGSSHGMVPSSERVRGDLRGVRSSPSQPFCHSHQCQASTLYLFGSRPNGLEAPLGSSVYLCLPTVCSAQAGLVESASLDRALVGSGGAVVSAERVVH